MLLSASWLHVPYLPSPMHHHHWRTGGQTFHSSTPPGRHRMRLASKNRSVTASCRLASPKHSERFNKVWLGVNMHDHHNHHDHDDDDDDDDEVCKRGCAGSPPWLASEHSTKTNTFCDFVRAFTQHRPLLGGSQKVQIAMQPVGEGQFLGSDWPSQHLFRFAMPLCVDWKHWQTFRFVRCWTSTLRYTPHFWCFPRLCC